ncbi:MAG: hypothetical protein ACFB22_14540 [Rhodothalassiaceae bacterium]
MSADIIELKGHLPIRTPIGHSIRIGHSAYKQLENLHAEGCLPARSVIVDASVARFQKEFIASLREGGAEIILDPKVAELSELGRFGGKAKRTPWAVPESRRPLIPSDFDVGSNADIYGQIARYAVELGATVVHAPTHFLRDGVTDPWFQIDRDGLVRLRAALDREGGREIAIDYPLIIPHSKIQFLEHRLLLLRELANLPFDNLVLRLSGFGASAGPLTTKRTFQAINEFNRLGYPIILDHVDGLVSSAALAFGIVSGWAHGIGEKGRFDARDWHKPTAPKTGGEPFGRAVYLPVPHFDKSFKAADFEAISKAQGGRRLLACKDKNCCPHGLNSMFDKPKAHLAFQSFQKANALFEVPDSRRAAHFLETEVRTAERKAGDLSHLKTGDNRLNKALADGRKRVDSLARMFETMLENERITPPAPYYRAKSSSANDEGTLWPQCK